MMHPLLCCTVAGQSMAELCRARDEASRHADLVELRLDTVRDRIDVAGALHGRTTPVVVTCRPTWEGGAFAGSEEERYRLLGEAIDGGAEYVDVEWRAGFDELVKARRGRGIVLSMHEFETFPADLSGRLAAMLSLGTEVVKLAVPALRLADCVRLAEAVAGAVANRSVVAIAMGVRGLATRVLPRRFGSCWSYAGNVAAGQLPAQEMLGQYRFRELTASTRVYGVAGSPVARSLSPAMHNAAFRAAGVDAVYLPLDTDSAPDLFHFADWLPLDGASVTSPLKTPVFHALKMRDQEAERAGSANTVVRQGHKWVASNTDIAGFRAPLEARALSVAGWRTAILGAGGAARAVALALGDAGARVSVHARRLPEAREVAGLVGGDAFDHLPSPGSWDLLVNATPVLWDSASAGLLGTESRGRWVYDLVSNPPLTPLLLAAVSEGCQAISGLEMLVAQGEAQAALWTGQAPPPGVMAGAAAARARGTTCE